MLLKKSKKTHSYIATVPAPVDKIGQKIRVFKTRPCARERFIYPSVTTD